MLPESIEQIAQKAETGAAELARSAIVLGYELLTDLVEKVRLSVQTTARDYAEPLANASSNTGQFLSVEEAAEFLRLKPSTLYSWVSNDKIPYSKVGSRILFEREALIEFVKTREGKRRRANNAQVSTPGKPREKDSQTPIRMVK